MKNVAVDPVVVLDPLRAQVVSYLHVSMLTLMAHDWLMLLNHEVEYIWQEKWGLGKIIYCISRYGPFVDVPIVITSESNLICVLTPHGEFCHVIVHTASYGTIDYDTCSTLYKIITWSSLFNICTSEAVLLLRTNAIYSGAKRIAIPLAAGYLVSAVAGVLINWRYLQGVVCKSFSVRVTDLCLNDLVGPPPSDLFEGCNFVRKSGIIFLNFLLLLLLELAVVILTAWKAFRDFYSGTPLSRVIYRDSISFFLILFVFTLSAILISALTPSQYNGLMAASTRVIHSIICCRILLNLRRAARRRDTSVDAPSGLVFATSGDQQITQSETILMEREDVGRDEENRGGGTGRRPIEAE